MKKFIIATAVTSLLLTTGCSTIYTSPKGTAEYKEILEFKPVEDKAVIYVYRRLDSDHKGQITTIDIGAKELQTVGNCVVRHVVDGGDFNIEPNGNGIFAIEKELDASFPNRSVKAIELKHTFRIAIPNMSELFLRDIDELKKAIEQDNLCIIDGVNII